MRLHASHPYDTVTDGMSRVTKVRRAAAPLCAAVALCAALGASSLALPAAAPASNASATHAYLTADYAVLHTFVGGWAAVESAIRGLDARYAAECPHVGAGSPQDEEEQKFSLEVAGALWSAAYHAHAAAIHSFVTKVSRLKWSSAAVNRAARKLTAGLTEMISLPTPPLCSDVRAWAANGYGAAPADVSAYAKHAEAIETKQIPPRLLAPFLSGSDRALAAADQRLDRHFEELEFVHGQDQWNKLLEILSLNQ